MIALSVMHLPFVFFTLIGMIVHGYAYQSIGTIISISTPLAGTVLQGIIPIQGTIKSDQYNSYEVSFGYSNDSTNTWFLIAQNNQVVEGTTLASWDTTQITDGNYRLRVLVRFNDGSTQQLVVNDLKVRNYTPPEPNLVTNEVAAASATPLINISKPIPNHKTATSTPYSVNPGSLSQVDFQEALTRGAGISGGIFVLLGLYFAFRKRPRRR